MGPSRLGRRGLSLLFFGLLDAVYSFSLLNPDQASREGPFLAAVAQVAPLWAWALAWGLTGVLCLIFAFQRDDRVGWTAAIFLKITWACACLLAWLAYGAPRGYVSAAIWVATAGFVWVISSWPEVEGRSAWTRSSWPPALPPESQDY